MHLERGTEDYVEAQKGGEYEGTERHDWPLVELYILRQQHSNENVSNLLFLWYDAVTHETVYQSLQHRRNLALKPLGGSVSQVEHGGAALKNLNAPLSFPLDVSKEAYAQAIYW